MQHLSSSLPCQSQNVIEAFILMSKMEFLYDSPTS